MDTDLQHLFDVHGLNVVITGGGGILCGSMARSLAALGANIAIADRDLEKAEKVATEIYAAGGEAFAVQCDVTDPQSTANASEEVFKRCERIDVLINGAGGNHPGATTSATTPFFDLDVDAIRSVFNLNVIGTIVPSQVFGRKMAAQRSGCIVNIASMNSYRPLTRIPAYSAAKAGVVNFTQWLAVYMAQEFSPTIRVNAIAPGFFLTDQNRYIMTDAATGEYSARGKKVLEHTPMGRLGTAEDLNGALLWLISPGAAFVTGIVVPVDGGFSAYSGV